MENLENYIGDTFEKSRFGSSVKVILEEVKKKQVKIREEGRKDSTFIPTEKFVKFFKHVNS